jgi:hypothetical protein
MLKKMFVLIAYLMLCNGNSSTIRVTVAATVMPQEALHVADFILSLQDAAGAIRDTPDIDIVNADSNMEYALMGVAAAYAYSRDERYLNALERGVQWLTLRQIMVDTHWRGSWFYAYSAKPPYAPVATSLEGGIEDIRGVDSTSSLFVYLLYLHKKVTGRDGLVKQYEANARAALDFVLAKNRSKDGFFYNAWHRRNGRWQLWKHQYAADQADNYLGLRAGSLLYDGPDRYYGRAADSIRTKLPSAFFSSSLGRYATGRQEDGGLDDAVGINMVFPQGYVPWVFGLSAENTQVYNWFCRGVQADGRLVLFSDDPGYSLAVLIFALAAASLNMPSPQASLQWLLSNTYDPKDGGVRDELDPNSNKYSNVAGFTVLALLRQRAW